MLSSARVGVRTRATAFASAFAESSRQAQLRPVDQGQLDDRKFPYRGYTAAAVLPNDHEAPRRHTTPRHVPSKDGDGSEPGRKPPSPPPDRQSERLTAGERFRRRVQTHPVETLLSLNDMTRADLGTLVPKDLLTMLYFVTQQVKPSPHLGSEFDPKRIAMALQITRSLLHARPTIESSRHRDAGLGYTLHGKALRALLRTGVLFGARDFVVELFTERMDEQASSGRKIVNTDGLAIDLAAAREWKLATTLFGGVSHITPAEVYTPRVVAISMTAHLCVNKPWDAVRLFELFDIEKAKDTPMTIAEARSALVRAHLQLGDIEAAQKAVHDANDAGIDNSAIQIAMLRGYRVLGYDADVERRVREDMDRLSLPPQSAVLNAFIWLRLDADNLAGAEAILKELETLAGDSPLDPETSLIAINVAARRGDIDRVRRVWEWLNSRPSVIGDEAVAHLCRALGRLHCPDEAIGILRAAVDGDESPWTLPPGFKAGIVTANSVLELATRTYKYSGLEEVTRLMRDGNIEPDERTLITLLEFASRNLVTSPASMSKLFKELLERTNVTPTVDQFNVILTRVLRSATRHPQQGELLPSDGTTTTDPTAGIKLNGKIHRLLSDQIDTLRASGQRSTGDSLSNRLIYDALALDGVWPVPAIQKTWQSFVLRGFRPTPKHYRSLLNAYAKIGAMDEAEDVLRRAKESMPQNEHDLRAMSTSLMVGWGQVGELKRARQVYESLRAGIGIDTHVLEGMMFALIRAGQPGAAVALARRDMALVTLDEGTVVTAAHAIRKNNDLPGCIFFVANFTEKDGGYTLTPRLRAVVVKALGYMEKVGGKDGKIDERGFEAVLLAKKMLDDDEVRRPVEVRRKPTLSGRNVERFVDLVAGAGRRDEERRGSRRRGRGSGEGEGGKDGGGSSSL